MSTFDQAKWDKDNLKIVVGRYRKEFVDEFNQACDEMGLVKSQLIREMMEETIKKWKEGK